jgi:hypothetical protein
MLRRAALAAETHAHGRARTHPASPKIGSSLVARRARSRSCAAAETRSLQRLRGAERRDSNPRPPGPTATDSRYSAALDPGVPARHRTALGRNWTPNGPRDGPVQRAQDVRNRGVCGGFVRSGRLDLNQRPFGPQPNARPARHRGRRRWDDPARRADNLAASPPSGQPLSGRTRYRR